MIKVGKWIAKHKILIIIIGIALLIPSYLGMGPPGSTTMY